MKGVLYMPDFEGKQKFVCPADPLRIPDLKIRAALGDSCAFARLAKLHYQTLGRRVIRRRVSKSKAPLGL